MKLIYGGGAGAIDVKHCVGVSVVRIVSSETAVSVTPEAALPRWSPQRHVHVQSSFYQQSTLMTRTVKLIVKTCPQVVCVKLVRLA